MIIPLTFPFTKRRVQWLNVWNMDCSSSTSRFNSQHQHVSSQPNVIPALGDPMSSSDSTDTIHVWGIQAYMQVKHPHIKKKNSWLLTWILQMNTSIHHLHLGKKGRSFHCSGLSCFIHIMRRLKIHKKPLGLNLHIATAQKYEFLLLQSYFFSKG